MNGRRIRNGNINSQIAFLLKLAQSAGHCGLLRGRACRKGRVTLDEAAGVEGQSVDGASTNGIVTY